MLKVKTKHNLSYDIEHFSFVVRRLIGLYELFSIRRVNSDLILLCLIEYSIYQLKIDCHAFLLQDDLENHDITFLGLHALMQKIFDAFFGWLYIFVCDECRLGLFDLTIRDLPNGLTMLIIFE